VPTGRKKGKEEEGKEGWRKQDMRVQDRRWRRGGREREEEEEQGDRKRMHQSCFVIFHGFMSNI